MKNPTKIADRALGLFNKAITGLETALGAFETLIGYHEAQAEKFDKLADGHVQEALDARAQHAATTQQIDKLKQLVA